MATLTYDPTPADQPEFNEEEQAALEVGEQLEQEQNQLLAGKYRDAEDLEQAYLELQQKLGRGEEVEEAPQEEEEETAPSSDLLDRLWNESDGEWSDDLLEELENTNSTDIAAMYLEYRNSQEGSIPTSQEMTAADVATVRDSVGGEAHYQDMINWASQNLTENEINLFDSVVEKGDPASVFFAVQALNYRFQDTVGYDGQLLSGSTPRQADDSFRSQAEVVAAMNDPRYENDPAYRNDVYARLESSNLEY